MSTTAWKLGNTGYYFSRRGDAVDSIRNTWKNHPEVRVVDYDRGDRAPGKIIVEYPDRTAEIELAPIKIEDAALGSM